MEFYVTLEQAYWFLKSALFNYSVDLLALLVVLLFVKVQDGFRWTYLPLYALPVWLAGTFAEYTAAMICQPVFGFDVFERQANNPFALSDPDNLYAQAAAGNAVVYAAIATVVFYPLIRYLLWKILDWNAEDGSPRLITGAILFCIFSAPVFVVSSPIRTWALSSAVTSSLVCATIEIYGLMASQKVWDAALRLGRSRQ